MMSWLKKRQDRQRTARELYGSIVTQARRKIYYAEWGVPDTREGRFEMIALHMVLALRRLADAGGDGRKLARAVTEAFVVDVDDTMREMTIGDVAVPRQVKRALAALAQRHGAYLPPLAQSDAAALQAALGAELSELDKQGTVDVRHLATYMCGAADALAGQADARLLAGTIVWPQV
jgi:cytochrome b pre-mRNA-processing protein 3